MAKKFLTIAEAAEQLTLSYSTLWRRVDAGEIASHRFGERSIRIPVRDFRDYVAKSRIDSGDAAEQQQEDIINKGA